MTFWQQLLLELGLSQWTLERLARHAADLIGIIVIVAAAFALYRISGRLLNRALNHPSRLFKDGQRRTILPLSKSIARYGIGLGALVLVLHQLGVNYTAILAGAGVASLAVGFGAQTLIRDFISGFFILFEGLIQVGDFIEVTDKSGTVEQIGLRTTQFRAFNGVLHSIPNGELTRFGNYNRDFSRAIVDVQLAYEQDARQGMAQAAAVVEKWAAERTDIVLEPPKVMGLFSFDASGVTVKISVKVKPQTHWEAERELRCRLKETFDREGVEIPFDRQVIYVRPEPPAAAR